MEPELSIDIESTEAQVAVSDEVGGEFMERVKKKLGEDIIFKEEHEAEMETLKGKYLEARDESDKLRKKVEGQAESLENLQEEKKALKEDLQNQEERIKRSNEALRGLLEDEIYRRVVEMVKEGGEVGVDFSWLKNWATHTERKVISKIERHSSSESTGLPTFPELSIDKLNDLRGQLLFLTYEMNSRRARGESMPSYSWEEKTREMTKEEIEAVRDLYDFIGEKADGFSLGEGRTGLTVLPVWKTVHPSQRTFTLKTREGISFNVGVLLSLDEVKWAETEVRILQEGLNKIEDFDISVEEIKENKFTIDTKLLISNGNRGKFKKAVLDFVQACEEAQAETK